MTDIKNFFDNTFETDDDNQIFEYDDSFIIARRQSPKYIGAVDWRYEKGGVFYID